MSIEEVIKNDIELKHRYNLEKIDSEFVKKLFLVRRVL